MPLYGSSVMYHLAIGKPALQEKWIIGSYFQVFSMVHITVAHAHLYASAIGDFSPDGTVLKKTWFGSSGLLFDVLSQYREYICTACHVTGGRPRDPPFSFAYLISSSSCRHLPLLPQPATCSFDTDRPSRSLKVHEGIAGRASTPL